MERGIIIGPEIEADISKNTLKLISGEPEPNLLRHAVLYWDKIEFSQSRIIHVESNDISFLEDEGIAQQTKIPVTNSLYGEIATMHVQSQLDAFEFLNNQEPGKWSIGQYTKNFFSFPNSKIIEKQIIEMELNCILPVPPGDTPLDDILQIKNKRKDEFSILRISVDELFNDALQWDSLPRGKNMAITRLSKTIQDIQRMVHSSWLTRKSSLKFEFNIPALTAGFFGGHAFLEYLGSPQLNYVGGLVGAAVAGIKLEKKFGVAPLQQNLNNFAALYYVEKYFPNSIKK